MDNLNLLYNKLYYSAVHLSEREFGDHARRCNQRLFSAGFAEDADHAQLMDQLASHQFILQTTYPGLLIGLGNAHSAGIAAEELVLGFSFDYVTGLPYIPGSTVKGALRSFFKNHPQSAAEVLGMDLTAVRSLESEIFDGHDVFFDAVVYDSNEYGQLIGPEYITPHSCPTDNPVPISMVKVMPGVRFKFRFRLWDSTHLTAEKKQKLFADLLCILGIGAKTNIGFGVLMPDPSNGMRNEEKSAPAKHTVQKKEQTQNQRSVSAPAARASARPSQTLLKDGEVIGKKCPHCGKMNYKYRREGTVTTNVVNWNWEKNVCFMRECRRSLE
jgi:CRISPR-associated protein Cmr6